MPASRRSLTGWIRCSRSPYWADSISRPRTTRCPQSSALRPKAMPSPARRAAAIDFASQIRLWSRALRPSIVFTLMPGCSSAAASLSRTMRAAWLPMLWLPPMFQPCLRRRKSVPASVCIRSAGLRSAQCRRVKVDPVHLLTPKGPPPTSGSSCSFGSLVRMPPSSEAPSAGPTAAAVIRTIPSPSPKSTRFGVRRRNCSASGFWRAKSMSGRMRSFRRPW